MVNRAEENKPGRGGETTQIIQPVSYNNKPLFLLEDAFDEYKTASSRKNFVVKHIETKNSGILHVVVWEHDNRDEQKLMTQAKTGKNHRAKYY